MLHNGTPRDRLNAGELPGQGMPHTRPTSLYGRQLHSLTLFSCVCVVPSDLGWSSRHLDVRRFNAATNVTAASTAWANTSTGSCKQEIDLSVTTPHNHVDPFSRPYLSPASLTHQVYSTWSTAVLPPLPPPQGESSLSRLADDKYIFRVCGSLTLVNFLEIEGNSRRLHSFSNFPTAYYPHGCDWALRSMYPHVTALPTAVVAPEVGAAFVQRDTNHGNGSTDWLATNTHSNFTSYASNTSSSTQPATTLEPGLRLPQRENTQKSLSSY